MPSPRRIWRPLYVFFAAGLGAVAVAVLMLWPPPKPNVRGAVLTKDGCVREAKIVFYDATGAALGQSTTDENGRFELDTRFPPGAYKVAIYVQNEEEVSPDAEPPVAGERNHAAVPAKYSSPYTSGLTLTVGAASDVYAEYLIESSSDEFR